MSRLDGAVDGVDDGASRQPVDPLAALRDPRHSPEDPDSAPGLRLPFDPDWFRPARLLVGALVVVGAVLVGAWLLRPPASPPVESTLPLASPASTSGPGPPLAAADTEVVVHVAGAVAAPGVYVLEGDPRVHDAVDRAGGATPVADLTRVNLAAPLTDGAYVYVPEQGEGPLPALVGPDSGADQPVSVNTASATELETLPGIGAVTAAAIIAHRDEIGAFATVDELLDVPGIGDAKLEAIRPLVAL